MRRGDIVSCVLPRAFGKPRPAVIVQSDAFAAAMITTIVCPLTSDLVDAPSSRLTVEPTAG